MGVVATFDWTSWEARYPELALADTKPITQAQAQNMWDDACIYHKNDGTGPINDLSVQTALLNRVTAHLAFLFRRRQMDAEMAASVGRVASATQGSVSTALENAYASGSAQWWQQTIYGSEYWALTARYRVARFVPGHERQFEPRRYTY